MGSDFTGPGGYWLLDTDTTNMLGYYETEAAALRTVAEVVREHGPRSPEAQHLLLYQDGAEERGLSGEALVDRSRAVAQRPERVIA